MAKNQPIAGVAPPELDEVTVMAVWPSVAILGIGQFLGRLYTLDIGLRIGGIPLTIGSISALLTAPLGAALYLLLRIPRFPLVVFGPLNPFSTHYRLTNRRLIVEHPFGLREDKAISLDRFDTINIEVPGGYDWFYAGDLVFYQGKTETFRIEAVYRPETFRQTCLKAQMSFVGVKKARELEAVG